MSLVRPEAAALATKSIRPDDRVLIIGAPGWFGRTTLALLADMDASQVLAVGTRQRQIRVGERTWGVGVMSPEAALSFDPTVVLNYAFLTREKWSEESDDEYRAVNLRLINQFATYVQGPSVRSAITVSSGAVHFPASNPYGFLKMREEQIAGVLATPSRAVVTIRAWSVSGPFVQRPRDYLFSDLLMQAIGGVIRVRAERAVMRRYVGVDDLVAIALAEASAGLSGTIDSGGPLIEAGQLADAIAGVTGASVAPRHVRPGNPADVYASDDTSWGAAIARHDYKAADIVEQIQRTLVGLASIPSLPNRRPPT
jgi:nucleoside-diphosphate-sugar epimerase